MEIFLTEDPVRRDLLACYVAELRKCGDYRLLDLPNNIVCRTLNDIAEGKSATFATIDRRNEEVQDMLDHPNEFGENERSQLLALEQEFVHSWRDMHTGGRRSLQRVKHPSEWTSPLRMIRYFSDNESRLGNLMAGCFDGKPNLASFRGRELETLRNAPPLVLYLEAVAIGIYQHAVQSEGHSLRKTKNPLWVDLQQAVYLWPADMFVTDDIKLRNRLQQLCHSRHPDKKIISAHGLLRSL